jgi:hypothetical protein
MRFIAARRRGDLAVDLPHYSFSIASEACYPTAPLSDLLPLPEEPFASKKILLQALYLQAL